MQQRKSPSRSTQGRPSDRGVASRRPPPGVRGTRRGARGPPALRRRRDGIGDRPRPGRRAGHRHRGRRDQHPGQQGRARLQRRPRRDQRHRQAHRHQRRLHRPEHHQAHARRHRAGQLHDHQQRRAAQVARRRGVGHDLRRLQGPVRHGPGHPHRHPDDRAATTPASRRWSSTSAASPPSAPAGRTSRPLQRLLDLYQLQVATGDKNAADTNLFSPSAPLGASDEVALPEADQGRRRERVDPGARVVRPAGPRSRGSGTTPPGRRRPRRNC